MNTIFHIAGYYRSFRRQGKTFRTAVSRALYVHFYGF